jgi:predicted secreted protein
MTIPQFFVAYAVCWWLVLFMLLPSGAAPEQKPALGNAPSAPANPRLKRKFGLATLWAILPTLLIYLVATTAKAEETIYHVGGGCKTLEKHVPAADVLVRDGYGVGDKQVKGANLEGEGAFSTMTDDVTIPLHIPSQTYIDRAAQASGSINTPTSIHGRNVDLSYSFIHAGELTVKPNGEPLLNGKPILNNDLKTGDCGNEN